MRLDKYLSQSSGLSRSQIRRLIKAGEALVNGTAIKDTSFQVNENARVSLAGEVISAPQARYFMLNKPASVVCANTDRDHSTVIDLLWQEPRAENLQIVGRLDIDSTGLVLITDDGQWNHHITSPRKSISKTYLVQLAQAIDEQSATRLREGVFLRNEKQRTKPAEVDIITPTQIRISISEGRYHQIKRMLAAVGNHVEALHRESIGSIILDTDLEPSEYRSLTETEIKSVL